MEDGYEKQAREALENILGYLSCPLSINVKKAFHGTIDNRELKAMNEDELRITIMLKKLAIILEVK